MYFLFHRYGTKVPAVISEFPTTKKINVSKKGNSSGKKNIIIPTIIAIPPVITNPKPTGDLFLFRIFLTISTIPATGYRRFEDIKLKENPSTNSPPITSSLYE